MDCGTQPELSPVSSISQPLAQLSLRRSGPSWDKGASLQLCGARGFMYLCICMNVYSYQIVLNSTLDLGTPGQLGLARRARSWQEEPMPNSRLLGPSGDEQAEWARSDLCPQHCTGHHQPPRETCACLLWTEATTFWLPNAFPLSQHLSGLELGPLYFLGLGHSVIPDLADWDPSNHCLRWVCFLPSSSQSTVVLILGHILKTHFSEMPQSRP